MRETYQPPTASPAGPPHDHTHPRHSCTHQRHSRTLSTSFPHPVYVIPAPSYVIPAPCLRHSRVGGNLPPASKPPKRRHYSRHLQKSTKSDRILQNTTETRVCAHARARQPAFRLPSLGMDCSQVAADSIRHTAWSCRLPAVMPINQTKPR